MSNDSTANRRQVGGSHYRLGEIQHWDWAQNLPYLEGQATRYIGRHMQKNGIEDVAKAAHFLEKIVERHYPHVRLLISFEQIAPAPGMPTEGPPYFDLGPTGAEEVLGEGPTPDYVNQDPDLKQEALAEYVCPECGWRVGGPNEREVFTRAAEHRKEEHSDA